MNVSHRRYREGSARRRVVIVGANFAGLTAAQRLSGAHQVTVVDQSPWFEWLPNIHELLSGVKQPDTLRLQRRRLVRSAGHRFVRARVGRIDGEHSRVHLVGGRTLSFDACIVAAGGVNETFGIPGAEQYAMPFKSVAECHAIGARLARLARRRQPMAVVIVGGGLEGVEALGEILRRYRQRRALRLHVVEAAPVLLPGTPKALDAAVRRHCARLDVRFHTGRRVTAVGATRVRLDSGEVLDCDVTIWTGGARPAPLLMQSHLAEQPRQWAAVRWTLQSRRFDNVFVVGDAAALPGPLSKQAFYAMQMGAHAAGNVERLLCGQPLRRFEPSSKPMVISFGDLDTFVVSGRTVLAGTALAALKEAVFELTMAQIDRPTTTQAVAGLVSRFAQGIAGVAIPALTSTDAVRRLVRVRVLR